MKHPKFSVIILFLCCFCCIDSFAEENKPVKFSKTITGSNGVVIIPLSEVLPPDGYLWDATLFINMNTMSLRTNIRIEKAGEGIVSNRRLSHDEDKVVEYDLSMYGSGEYTVTITFSDGETYEAVIIIE